MGTEYLTTRDKPPFIGGPAMKGGTGIGARVAHASSALSPITASSAFDSSSQAGALSAIGIGVHGKTDNEREAIKERRRLRKAEGG